MTDLRLQACRNCLQYEPDGDEDSCSYCGCSTEHHRVQGTCPPTSASKKCAIEDCSRPCYVDEHGVIHECCGLRHAMEHRRLQHMERSKERVKGITHCLLPGCNRPTYPFKNYCNREHADRGIKMKLQPPTDQKDNSLCIIPECFRRKCIENGKMHDYCGKYCANDGRIRNIRPTTDDPKMQCSLSGCRNKCKREKNGRMYKYCCKEHSEKDRAAPGNILTCREEVLLFLNKFPQLSGYTLEDNSYATNPDHPLFRKFKEAWESLPPSSRNTCLAFHGTSETNIQSICRNGYDQSRRGSNVGQVYGAGEYFSEVPDTALRYARGNPKKLILNELLLGDATVHHTKVGDIIVMKYPQHDLPRFIVTLKR